MILTSIGNKGLYPEFVGRRALWVGSGPGPASYSQATGDVVTLAIPNYYIDAIAGRAERVSGNYYVRPRPSGAGARQTWSRHWYDASTNAEVSDATDLSGETIQLGVFCGQF